MTHWNLAICYRKLEQYENSAKNCAECWRLELIESEASDPSVLQTVIRLIKDLIAAHKWTEATIILQPIKNELQTLNRSEKQELRFQTLLNLEKEIEQN